MHMLGDGSDMLHLAAQAATPLSAAFEFFLRDFAGMLGGILFALAQARALLPVLINGR